MGLLPPGTGDGGTWGGPREAGGTRALSPSCDWMRSDVPVSCVGWGWGPQNHDGTRTDVPMLGPEPLSPCPPRDEVGRPYVGTGTDSPCSLWDGAGSPQSRDGTRTDVPVSSMGWGWLSLVPRFPDGTRTDVPKVVPKVCCAPCHDGTQTDVPTMTHCPHVLHGVGLSVPHPRAGTWTDVLLDLGGWGQRPQWNRSRCPPVPKLGRGQTSPCPPRDGVSRPLYP